MTLRRRRGVVFDFGNVLYRVDYPAMAARLAGARGPELLRSFVGSPLQVAWETGATDLDGVLRGLADQGFRFDREAFLAAYLEVFSPIEGMAALVAELSGRMPLGLLSNTSPEHARLFVERTPEFAFFRAHLYSFEMGAMKPDPRLYREVARRLGLAPGDLAYVDDLAENVGGARAVGMEGFLFTGEGSLRRALAPPGPGQPSA